jgi:hypothetical protein
MKTLNGNADKKIKCIIHIQIIIKPSGRAVQDRLASLNEGDKRHDDLIILKSKKATLYPPDEGKLSKE